MAGIEAHYISQNSFWIYTDRTSEFVYGRRLKANCGSDGYKYTTISGSSFSHPKTTVTVLDNVLTNNLSEVWYGISVGSEGSLPVHKHTSQSDGGLFYIPGLQKLTYEYTSFLASYAKDMSWKTVASRFKTSWQTVFRSVKKVVEYGLKNRKNTDFKRYGIYKRHKSINTSIRV